MHYVSYSDVVIEVTRRCNMTCEHCLRGAAQNLNQTKENIDKFFQHTGDISHITFTGGEPSLVPEVIDYTRESAIKHGVEVGNFFIATNGKNITEAFVIACLKWWSYCFENEATSVELSQDDFHEDKTSLNYGLLEGLSFFRERRHLNSEYTLEQGRGKEFATGRKVEKEYFEVYEEQNNCFRVGEGVVYLNCKGELIAGCDWSFRNQHRYKLCNVGELTLEHMEDFGADIEYLEAQ